MPTCDQLYQVLEVSDGTDTVNMLNKLSGFFVTDWTQRVTQPKDGGTWSDSSLSDGRKLRDKHYQNVEHTWETQCRSYNPDKLIEETQNLRRLLEKAAAYSPVNWQDGPVWIKRQGLRESKPTYILIEDYRTPGDAYPFSNQDNFWNKLGQAAFPDWPLIIETEPFWRSVPPGQRCPEAKTESVGELDEGCDPSFLTFDGSDSICNCGSDPSLDDIPDNAVAGRGKITVEAIIRARGWGEGNQGQIIGKPVSTRWNLYLSNTVGLQARIACAAQVAISTSGLDEFGTAQLGEFVHVVMCYDETGADTPAARTIYLAIGGHWVTSYGTQQVSIGNYVSDAAQDLIIGNNSGNTQAFDGDIAMVRVSDRIVYDPAGGDFTPPEMCDPPLPTTGTQLLLTHSPGYGATTEDQSGYGNDGALSAVLWGCDCEYSETVYGCWPNYLQCNGETGDVNCGLGGNIDNIPSGGDITVQGWIRARSWGEDTYGRIIIKGSAAVAGNGWHLFLNSASGLNAYVDCVTQDAISSSGLDEFGTDKFNEWVHVLFCYSEAGSGSAVARTVYLAIGGVWVASYPTQQVSIGAYSGDGANNLLIGNAPTGTGTFDGDIGWLKVDSAIIYDPGTDFTPEPRCELPNIVVSTEIQVIQEGQGTVTYDRTGNGNNGTITTFTWGCDCDYTDTDDVECNCVEISALQEDWEHENWAVQDNQPLQSVHDILELRSGRMLACDDAGEVWHTDDGTAPWVASTTPPGGAVACWAMVEHPSTDGEVYLLGAIGVGAALTVCCYRSVDAGDNWVQQNANITGLAGSAGVAQNDIAYFAGAIYVSLGDVQAVTGVLTRSGVWKSTDAGVTWVQTLAGDCTSIEETAEYLYISDATPPGSGSVHWIKRSPDGSAFTTVFTRADGGGYCQCIKRLDDQYLYALSDRYIYRSLLGDAWERVCDIGSAAVLLDIDIARGGIYYLTGYNTDTIYKGDIYTWQAVVTAADGMDQPGPIEIYDRTQVPYVGGGFASTDIWKGPEFQTVGRDETCKDEVVITNQSRIAQLTEIFVYDSTLAVYHDRWPAAAFPFFLLPSPFVAGDFVAFCIENAVLNSGPYCSLVFDLLQPAGDTNLDLVWEYSTGGPGWNTLTISANPLLNITGTGLNVITWVPPDDWLPQALNGVTGLWVRCIVNSVTLWLQSPIQQHRDVYTPTRPSISIADDVVLGDVAALLRAMVTNRSDLGGYHIGSWLLSELNLMDSRIITAVRSEWRGPMFRSQINLAEDGVVASTWAQNVSGVTVTDGTGTVTIADKRSPCGIVSRHTCTGNGLDSYDDALEINFGPSVARDYYGEFHVFLRAQLEDNAASPVGDDGDVRIQLQFRTGTGGIQFTTQFRKFIGWDANGDDYKDFQLLDFGRVTLPVSGLFKQSELPDEFTVIVQVASTALTNLYVLPYNLILIPVDEWSGDFSDAAYLFTSGIDKAYYLDADSVNYPARQLRAMVRQTDGDFTRSIYEKSGVAPAVLQAKAGQRVFFLAAVAGIKGEETVGGSATTLTDDHADFIRAGVQPGMPVYNGTTGNTARVTAVAQTELTTEAVAGNWNLGNLYLVVCPRWSSNPYVAHSIKMEYVARYLSMRGAR